MTARDKTTHRIRRTKRRKSNASNIAAAPGLASWAPAVTMAKRAKPKRRGKAK